MAVKLILICTSISINFGIVSKKGKFEVYIWIENKRLCWALEVSKQIDRCSKEP